MPPVESSYFHPNILPNAFDTTFAKLIIAPIALFNALTRGFSALMNDEPITDANSLKFSFKILTWLAHVSCVRKKSPCAAPVFAMTY